MGFVEIIIFIPVIGMLSGLFGMMYVMYKQDKYDAFSDEYDKWEEKGRSVIKLIMVSLGLLILEFILGLIAYLYII